MIQALFVDTSKHGIYPRLLGRAHCWGEKDDARRYNGCEPVIAHPPCQLWTNMARVNYKRYALDKDGNEKPGKEYLRPGNDQGCFLSAYLSVRRWGGVLEHPAGSHAWGPAYDIGRPAGLGRWWRHCFGSSELGEYRACWVCEVCQSEYGHKAQKRTWLMYCGRRPPFDLRWGRSAGTHQIGWFDRIKPTLSKREASATPEAFAQTLILLAEWSRG